MTRRYHSVFRPRPLASRSLRIESLEHRTLLSASVVGRHVFYNNSYFDGYDTAAETDDFSAMASHAQTTDEDHPDMELGKDALLPGQSAAFKNYTNYSKGINGIMVDIAGLANPSQVGLDDFCFKIGNDNSPNGWSTAPTPDSLTLFADSGVNGSDRFTIIWEDNDVEKLWLQVKVLATDDTELQAPDVFYFGNALAESGDSTTWAKVDATDQLMPMINPHSSLDPATVDDPYDYNRDSIVDDTDKWIAFYNQTYFATDLNLITVPAADSVPTTIGIDDVSVNEDAANTVIDLFDAFADAEDDDEDLAYTIRGNTNTSLFSATTISGAAGTLTLDYAQNAYGSADITVRATDTEGAWVETTFTVSVAAVNDTPTTVGIDDVSVNEDAADTVIGLFDAFADVEDADGDLTYTITANTNTSLFAGTTINGTAGTLTLDYAQNAYGTGSITVRATDTGGAWVETEFDVSVTAVNDTPTTAGIDDVNVEENAADTVIDLFDAFADVEDADDDLTYTITTNTNTSLFSTTTISGVAGTLTLEYAADITGTADITVRATDTASAWVETTFTVTVSPPNTAPTCSGFAEVEVAENAADTVIDLFAAFADAEDADDDLTYTITGSSNPSLLDSATIDGVAGTLTLDYAADAYGNGTLTVRAADTGGLWIETVLGYHLAAATGSAPVLYFTPTSYGDGYWELTGRVVDADSAVGDVCVHFGGILTSEITYLFTNSQGFFNGWAEFDSFQPGYAWAWTYDAEGHKSNVVTQYMVES